MNLYIKLSLLYFLTAFSVNNNSMSMCKIQQQAVEQTVRKQFLEELKLLFPERCSSTIISYLSHSELSPHFGLLKAKIGNKEVDGRFNFRSAQLNSAGTQLLSQERSSFCDNGSRTRLWSIKTGKVIYDFSPADYAWFGINDTIVVTYNVETGVITSHNVKTREKIYEFKDDSVGRIVVSVDGTCIVSLNRSNNVKVRDIATGKVISTCKINDNDDEYKLINSFDGTQIVIASIGCETRLWDTKTGKLIRVFEDSLPIVGDESSIDFSSDGKELITFNKRILYGEKVIRIWDMSSGQVKQRFIIDEDEDEDSIDSAKLSHDGKFVIGCCFKAAKIWDRETGQAHYIWGHEGFVKSAQFSSNDTHVITANAHTVIKVWDSPLASCTLSCDQLLMLDRLEQYPTIIKKELILKAFLDNYATSRKITKEQAIQEFNTYNSKAQDEICNSYENVVTVPLPISLSLNAFLDYFAKYYKVSKEEAVKLFNSFSSTMQAEICDRYEIEHDLKSCDNCKSNCQKTKTKK